MVWVGGGGRWELVWALCQVGVMYISSSARVFSLSPAAASTWSAPQAAAYSHRHGQPTAGTARNEQSSVPLAMVPNHPIVSPARKGLDPGREAPTTCRARATLDSRRHVGEKRKQPAMPHLTADTSILLPRPPSFTGYSKPRNVGDPRPPKPGLPPTRRHAACTASASPSPWPSALPPPSAHMAASHAALVSNGTSPPQPPHTNASQLPCRHSYRRRAARQWPDMPHSPQRSRPTRAEVAAKTSAGDVAAARAAAVAGSPAAPAPALTPPPEGGCRGRRWMTTVRRTGTATHSKQRGKMVPRSRR